MNCHSSPLRKRSESGSAFTLVELIAVLGVLGLLAWIATDGALARVKRSHRQAEAAELNLISGAWIQAALRTRILPSETNWISWLSSASALPPSRIMQSRPGNLRQLVYDPVARYGRPLAVPPFAQTAAGSLEPVQPRWVLVSSLTESLPDLRSVPFEALWAHSSASLPLGWPGTWSGEPADLRVERMDLRGRFHRVVLHNLEASTTAGYGISGQSGAVAPNGRLEGWFLEDSLLELRLADGSVQAVEVVSEDLGHVFERGRWRRQLMDGPAHPGGIGAMVDQFLASPVPAHSVRSTADQAAVVDEWVQFVNAYVNWAVGGFPVSAGTGSSAHPLHRSVVESQARLHDFSEHLLLP